MVPGWKKAAFEGRWRQVDVRGGEKPACEGKCLSQASRIGRDQHEGAKARVGTDVGQDVRVLFEVDCCSSASPLLSDLSLSLSSIFSPSVLFFFHFEISLFCFILFGHSAHFCPGSIPFVPRRVVHVPVFLIGLTDLIIIFYIN